MLSLTLGNGSRPLSILSATLSSAFNSVAEKCQRCKWVGALEEFDVGYFRLNYILNGRLQTFVHTVNFDGAALSILLKDCQFWALLARVREHEAQILLAIVGLAQYKMTMFRLDVQRCEYDDNAKILRC